jgi:phosphinothricin acetyltransferase
MINIRPMRETDLQAVNEIYNQAVDLKFSTAHTRPVSMEYRREWFRDHDPDNFPVLVWDENSQVIAWFSFSPYRKGRPALQSTAEISYYVHTGHHNRGIGSRMMEYALELAPRKGFKNLIAILLDPNTASISLLKKYGFELWGDMPSIAEIDGGQYNHQYYGLRLTSLKK